MNSYRNILTVLAALLLLSHTASSNLAAKCNSCKKIVNRFTAELKRTANGNFGGGNSG